VTTSDGLEFTGMSARDIVSQMRHTRWGAIDKGDYKAEVLGRIRSITGKVIPNRMPSPTKFLTLLADAGLVTIIDTGTRGTGRPPASP
jgi:hypothetical protein